ncbi:hypothetical protein K402DRAFT_452856 [Aulographum hederae CBS 113979]|uniref:Ubiquitin-like domain-containing protein n=1 Tax=Aulographum hederae CBS 113979 TaxID=1176131 RepID=A0A6G1H607_9PEZI|nr:hypothetical protein K402DRAFT_452856 [Aulographum hederae CBS 113979]
MAQPQEPGPLEVRLGGLLDTYGGHKEIKVTQSSSLAGSNRGLQIRFHRILRVADNNNVSRLPPNEGVFPIYSVDQYKDTLPEYVVKKGGAFFPMYQREAMWMSFSAQLPFAIKVYVGGVNAISGEPMIENPKTRLRRLALRHDRKRLQDYVVAPQQLWLDGIASTDACVRQFVAMPSGAGYSVEAQSTGEEHICGLQFEVVPLKSPLAGPHKLFIRTLTGKTVCVRVDVNNESMWQLKWKIYSMEGIEPAQQRLIFAAKQFEDDRILKDCGIHDSATIHLILRLRGGGPGPTPKEQAAYEMGVAADKWNLQRAVIFNVQVLNSAIFKAVTGADPPPTPVTAATYVENGLPYFEIYDEKPSGIKGNFTGVESVNELDKSYPWTLVKQAAIREVDRSHKNLIIRLNTDGTRQSFQPVQEMKEDLETMLRAYFAENARPVVRSLPSRRAFFGL